MYDCTKIFEVFVYNVSKNDYNITRKEVIKIKFNMRLKELRLANGLTQKELAKSIEVGRTTISEYESGKIVPKHEGLLKLANYFNVSVDYLTGVSDEPATRQSNEHELDKLLNTLDYILMNEYDSPVRYEGVILNTYEKLMISQFLEQVRDNVELMLDLRKKE